MSSERPTVSPDVIATMIESTPDRVRRRLDRAPDVAASWEWRAGDVAWSIDAGGEVVNLPHGHIAAIEQLSCSCLLSPRCFHVLACLTRLQVAIVESLHEETTTVERAHHEFDEDLILPNEKQRHAARNLVSSLAWLLRVGVANAGVVVQSGLLRAVHQCRAEGLHRLGGLGLRIIAGTNEYRSRSPAADPAQLAEDLGDALETSRLVLSQTPIARIGTSRRKFSPVRPRKLHGLLAEPIITRSGFSGAAVYFLGEDGRIYTASDVRPGDAQQARNAYLGGIEIGPLTLPARQLSRGLYLGTELSASDDGRLGRGKGIKIVEQGQSSWQSETVQKRFRRPLSEQWNAIYTHSSLPADARPAGWNFVFVDGTVLGAVGPELWFQPTAEAPPIRLAIENDNELLYFRENLRMLSYAPGLRLQLIGPMNLLDPRIVFPFAIAPVAGESWPSRPDGARLELPESLGDRVCLGFDELQRRYLVNAQAAPLVLSALSVQTDEAHPLESLRRRWLGVMLSGIETRRTGNPNVLAAETTSLSRNGFPTAAALLDSLLSAPSNEVRTGVDTFLATAVYLRASTYALAKTRAVLVE